MMEEPGLPVLLVNEIGGVRGVSEAHLPFLKKHFNLITMKEFLENKAYFSEKVKAIYLWYFKPDIDKELLMCLPKLQVIANAEVGMDHLDLKLISGFGVRMASTPDALCSATAEGGIALLLAAARRLLEGCQIAVSPDTEYFASNWLGDEVTGATLGIIGMGNIGYRIAQKAKAFEMKILYHNRNRRKEKEELVVGASYCSKPREDLLQQSDFVMLVVNLTPQAYKLTGKKELELMKPTATLINISRGPVVEQDMLLKALQTGVIKGAVMDITYPEPLPRDHPLLKLKNVLITPPLAGRTTRSSFMVMKEAVENILAALSGLPMPSEVFPD
ncbi:LOW QUALITY PROTEIN: probable 2-ketogluconate reductase [Varanus komodoensis]|uniref:LOW QUALITY PROTEIN: probable 2-ketogluconate reductase n=1 Tax=Varanus komodoensis TaxID=61221 RepID=UPI001CF7DD7E|nr:LOW QUALITY PROTEIN: probable 2-ketogluconate reductase [Varanus komodoensis]